MTWAIAPVVEANSHGSVKCRQIVLRRAASSDGWQPWPQRPACSPASEWQLRLRNRRRAPQGPHASAAQVRAAQVRAASVPAVPGLALRVCHRRDLVWGRSDQARACRRRLSRVHPLFRAHRDDRKSELFEPALILDHLAMQSVARMSRDGRFASAHARSRPQQDTAST